MKVVFRADASLQIGTGHVMRCLTLARGLASRGHECSFLIRRQDGNLAEYISECGFPVYESPLNGQNATGQGLYGEWLACSPEEDAYDFRCQIQSLKPDWIVLDHYALGHSWIDALNTDARVLVVDDLANRKHACDLLLDQTLGREPADYVELVPGQCQILCGAQYALLRPEFKELRTYSLNRRKNPAIKQILVAMGGIDKDNATEKVLSVLAKSNALSSAKLVVVLGSASPWVNDVEEFLKVFPEAELRVNEKSMADLMADSDLAIGAAGSTSWERCCLGLPTILVVLAENQRKVAFELERFGAAMVVNSLGLIDEDLSFSIRKVLDNPIYYETLSKRSAEVTDGTGCIKVIEAMESMVRLS